jgi:hypothetical protein
MDRKNNEYVGKKLHEVKKLYKNVRVLGAGPVSMAGTCDYRLDRLNVLLSEEGIKFKQVTITLRSLGEQTFTEVDGSMDEGIVTEAWWG